MAWAFFGLLASAPARAGKLAEAPIQLEVTLKPGESVALENLVGSIEVQGGGPAGRVKVEGRVVAEAKSQDEADALARSVSVDRRASEGGPILHVVFPLDRSTSYFPPRDPGASVRTLAGWMDALAALVSDTNVVYDDKSVRIGRERGSTGLAVHLAVTLPEGASSRLDLRAGSIRLVRVRGRVAVVLGSGRAVAEQTYGALEVSAGASDVTLRTFKGEKLHVEVGSGDASLVDVDADTVDLSSGSGQLQASRVRAKSATATSASGDLLLDGLEATRLTAATASGSLTLATNLERMATASLRSDTGDVLLKLGAYAPFRIAAESATGSIRANGKQITVESATEHSAKIHRGAGGTEIRIETATGDVEIAPR